MRCGRRNNAPYELCTNLPGVRSGPVRTPFEFAGARVEPAFAVATGIRPRTISVRTPGEFVRAPYEFRMNSPESVRSSYVCAVPAGIRTRTNSVLTPREFVRAAYGLRTNSPEFVRSSYALCPQE